MWTDRVWTFLQSQSDGLAHHGIVIAVFSLAGLLGGWILHRWKLRRYGCLLNVRVCIMDPVPGMEKVSFRTATIWEGPVADWIHDLSAAAALTRASRRTRRSGILGVAPASFARIYQLCANQIRQQFADGFVAKAMDDEGVTQRTFLMGLFKDPEGSAPVTLLLITTEDWHTAFHQASLISADEDETRYLEWSRLLSGSNTRRIVLYM